MFKQDKEINPNEAETIIGEGVKVEGTFEALGNVIVKGQVSGSVSTKSDLLVREKGSIEANVKAKNVSIAGEIKGNLNVEGKIELASTAHIDGDLDCQVLAIEEGAILNGKCSVGKETTRVPSPQEESEEERPEFEE